MRVASDEAATKGTTPRAEGPGMLERALALGAVVSLLLGAGFVLKEDSDGAAPRLPGPRFLDEPAGEAPPEEETAPPQGDPSPAQPGYVPPAEPAPPPEEREDKKDEGKGKPPSGGLLGGLIGDGDEPGEDDGDD